MKWSRVKNSQLKLFKFIIIILMLIVVLGLGYYSRINQKNYSNKFVTNGDDFVKAELVSETNQTKVEPAINSENHLIKNFPWQSQAPMANWDELHNEACEEASIILVNNYLLSQTLLPEQMDQEILKMVAWEEKNFGGHFDLTVKQTQELAKKFYGLDGKIIKNGNIDILKNEIAKGHAVIVPTAGRLLGNPNFRSPGPVYHMVVAIGYDAKNIIVQDVGTRNGNHYIYNQEIFANAWHDWAGEPDKIEQGGRNMLVLEMKSN